MSFSMEKIKRIKWQSGWNSGMPRVTITCGLSDAMTRSGRGTLPLLLGGVAVASACLGLLALGVRNGQILLWSGFFGGTTAAVLSYSLFSRRYPKEMVGRVNSALNVSVFIGIFSGQWVVGLVLNLWPQTETGYAPEAYGWALGVPWLLQFAGLAWLWRGRHLLQQSPPRSGSLRDA